jgi:hypothetical protein
VSPRLPGSYPIHPSDLRTLVGRTDNLSLRTGTARGIVAGKAVELGFDFSPCVHQGSKKAQVLITRS